MKLSRIRRQRRHAAEKMLEMVARGAVISRHVDPRERRVVVCADLPKPGGGGWFMQVQFPIHSLRGDIQP